MPPPSRDSSRPGADQPRQQVFQLRELDLQLAFARPRAPREDVEDQLRAIDDAALEPLLQLAQLRRRQLVVEDDDVDVGFGRGAREQIDFAAAEKRRGVGLGPLLQHAQHDLRAGGVGEAGQLFERMFGVDAARRAGDETDEGRALMGARGRLASAAFGTILRPSRDHGAKIRTPIWHASNAILACGSRGPGSLRAGSSGLDTYNRTVPELPIEFVLFALTLVGVAVFHHRAAQSPLSGLAAITLYKLVFAAFEKAPGSTAWPGTCCDEWVVLANLAGLLLGFALLSRHFEESQVPKVLPRFLPDGLDAARSCCS